MIPYIPNTGEDQKEMLKEIGGAILHRNEITYSLACSTDGFIAFSNIEKTQQLAHQAIILGLQSLGMNAELERKQTKRSDRYFCFVNPCKDDVVKDGKKIVGSAQRRSEIILGVKADQIQYPELELPEADIVLFI